MFQPHNASSHPSESLTTHHSWSLLVSIIFIVVFCAVAWFASPKGENQTYVIATYLRAMNYIYCAASTSLTKLATPPPLNKMPRPSTPLANTTSSQCLALNPHPLCLELLAHVGYVSDSIPHFLKSDPRLTTAPLHSNHFLSPVAPPHHARAQRPATRVQRRSGQEQCDVLDFARWHEKDSGCFRAGVF